MVKSLEASEASFPSLHYGGEKNETTAPNSWHDGSVKIVKARYKIVKHIIVLRVKKEIITELDDCA